MRYAWCGGEAAGCTGGSVSSRTEERRGIGAPTHEQKHGALLLPIRKWHGGCKLRSHGARDALWWSLRFSHMGVRARWCAGRD